MLTARDRPYSAREVHADRWVHRVGISVGLAAAAALIAMLAARHATTQLMAGIVYASGLVAMLTLSAAYNLTPPSPRKDMLQRFDHAAIFVMIAGTYTPFLATMTAGLRRAALLAAIWLLAGIGSALKLAFPRRLEGLAVITYLLVGWAPLLILAPLYEVAAPLVLALLAIGGVIYTVGVAFHLWEALPYHRAIWHGMVLAAAGVHYGAVLAVVVAAG